MVVPVYTRCYTVQSIGRKSSYATREEASGKRKKKEDGRSPGSLGRSRARKKAPNKNTNRSKVGFAFDKHRKKAQRKVITYTSANYDRPTPRCSAA